MTNYNHLQAYRPTQKHFESKFNLSKILQGLQTYRLVTEGNPLDEYSAAVGEIPEIQKNQEYKFFKKGNSKTQIIHFFVFWKIVFF
jgi:hypothetical protein